MRCTLPRLSLSLSLLVTPLDAGVHVVDSGGGGDFTDLQAAIDAASPGDTLLVKAGNYLGVTVSKGIEILADPVGDVSQLALLTVDSIPADETLFMRGFPMSTTTVSQSAGVVWFEAVEMIGSDALTVTDSARVVVNESTVTGNNGVNFGVFFFDPGRGIVASGSTVFLPGTEVVGGRGWSGASGLSGWDGGPGATGVQLTDSTLVLGGTTIVGGEGGSAQSVSMPCADAGDGGVGLVFVGTGSSVHRLDAGITGGEGGTDPTILPICIPSQGADGADTTGTGSIQVLGTTGYMGMTSNAPVREGENLLLSYYGAPSVLTFVAFGTQPAAYLAPALFGGVFFSGPYTLILTGTNDPAGEGGAAFPVGNLPPALSNVTFYAQSGYVTGANVVVVGSPAAVPILDASL